MKWVEHYSRGNKPGSFVIENRGTLGVKLRVVEYTGTERVYWPEVKGEEVLGINGVVPSYIREAVREYFKDPMAFRKVIVEELDVPQTMVAQERPDLDAESNSMENYSDDDMEKAKDKSEGMTEVPDSELHKTREAKSNRHKKSSKGRRRSRLRETLYLCNECFSTFRSKTGICTECRSHDVDMITPKEVGSIVSERENSDLVGSTDYVFDVKYDEGGGTKHSRVSAFDEAGARRAFSKTHKDAKITGVKKLREAREARGRRDGTGPYKGSYRRKESSTGRRKARGEICPVDKKKSEKSSKVRGRRDGTGPYKGSYRRKESSTGRRKARGEICPVDKKKKTTKESKVNEGDREMAGIVTDTVEELVSQLAGSMGISHLEALDFVKDNLPEDSRMEEMDSEAEAGDEELKREIYTDESKTVSEQRATDFANELVLSGEISTDDKQALNAAIKSGAVEDELPDNEVMIDQLSTLEDILDPSELGSDVDIVTAYLKHILVPKAISGVPEDVEGEPGAEEDPERYFARELVKHLEKRKAELSDDELELLNRAKRDLGESKEASDEMVIVAKGLADRAEADRMARDKKGQVIEDPNGEGKLMVVVSKEQ